MILLIVFICVVGTIWMPLAYAAVIIIPIISHITQISIENVTWIAIYLLVIIACPIMTFLMIIGKVPLKEFEIFPIITALEIIIGYIIIVRIKNKSSDKSEKSLSDRSDNIIDERKRTK